MSAMVTDSLQTQVLRQLSSFLGGEISRVDLEDWLAQQSYSIGRGDDPAAEDLIDQAELYLAEFSSGHRTSEDLRALFQDLITRVFLDLAPAPRQTVRIRMSSVASDRDFKFEFLSP
jgi:hypothetical protein